jgi:hypothetical protein
MSEANTPETNAGLPEAGSASAQAWYAGWDNFVTDATNTDAANPVDVPPTIPEIPETEWHDWQTVNFPNALNVDAIERQTAPNDAVYEQMSPSWVIQAAPTPAIDLPTWAQNDTDSATQPQIADLISLIQELNQCNSALIDRVSFLEESLDRSESALQSERERSPQPPTVEPEELVLAQQRAIDLQAQLEVAQQAQQQQQAQTQELTQQLEVSQQQVAQLERECAAAQQRFNEQQQQLVQVETTCRDLRVRLQRQQRYTLQFKAALERCLEVEPHLDTTVEAEPASLTSAGYDFRNPLMPPSFLPKVQRIQPWSSTQLGSLAERKLEALMQAPHDLSPLPAESELEVTTGSEAADTVLEPVYLSTSVEKSSEKPSDHLAENPFLLPTEIPLLVSASSVTTIETSEINRDESTGIQPLATQTESTFSPLSVENDLSAEEIEAQLAELQPIQDDVWDDPLKPAADTKVDEATLWQDLARLIDISTDDLIKANLEDIAQFAIPTAEVTNLQPVAPQEAIATPEPPTSVKQRPKLKLPLAQETQANTTIPPTQTVMLNLPGALAANPGSPSPIVYPLRPLKKLPSLAAVDLPTFPRNRQA